MSLETMVRATIELFYGGVWNDITPDVYDRDGGIRITRGRRDEGSAVDPGSMTLQLRGGRSKVNPAIVGRYSPKNPRSDLYGKIGRYTPIRVRVPSQRAGLLLRNTRDGQHTRRGIGLEVTRAFAHQVTRTVTSPTGDIDIRIDVTPETWHPQFADVLMSQWSFVVGGRGWWLTLQGNPTSGFLSFRWSSDGVNDFVVSSNFLGTLPARRTVRVTMDVDDGAGNRVLRFWLGDSIDGPFTQLGTDKIGTATSIFASTAAVEAGSIDRGRGGTPGTNPLRGTIHAMQVRSGIDGTILADPDFEAQEPASASGSDTDETVVDFTDSAGRLWRLQHYAQITNPGIRAHMQMVRWPQRWDTSGEDGVWVPAEAGGVMRPLANRQEISQSTMRRFTVADPDVVAYWPCEDGRESRQLAAATPATDPLNIRGEVTLAEFDGFAGSFALPVLGGGLTLVRGAWVPFHPFGGDQFRGLFAVPDAGLTDGATVVFLPVVFSGSTFERVQVIYGTGGTLNVQLRDEDGVTVASTGPITFTVDGQQFLLEITLDQDGADIDWFVNVAKMPRVGGAFLDADVSGLNGTFVGQTFGRISRVRVGIDGLSSGLTFGHLTVLARAAESIHATTLSTLLGFTGEWAGNRFLRLAAEEGVSAYLAGDPGAVGTFQFDAQNRALTEPMGPQRPGGFLTLLQECADTDHGIMYESRDQTALVLQPRIANYRVGPAVTLSYSAGHLSPPFFPEDDDRFLTNDVTVSRPDGSSARVQQEGGPLSTQPPPDGIGRGHAIAPALSVVFDQRCGHHASKLLHEGVWDEPRYSMVSVDLRKLVELDDATDLREALLQLDTGFRADVIDLPDWLPADSARLIVQGYDEQIERGRHVIMFSTTPYGPTGQVGIYGDPAIAPAPDAPQRYSPVDYRATASFTSGTDTALSVEDQTGGDDLLSQTADFPLDILVSGVRLRVTAVGAPAGAVQVLTVELAPVNGIIKTIPAGSRMELYTPARYAL